MIIKTILEALYAEADCAERTRLESGEGAECAGILIAGLATSPVFGRVPATRLKANVSTKRRMRHGIGG
jgi:hypothetical protein